MINGVIFKSIKQEPNAQKALLSLIEATWGPITLASPVLKRYWASLFRYYPEFQFVLQKDNTIIGYACTVPFLWQKDLKELPQEGWDWLLQNGISLFEKKEKANFLGGLMIGVAPDFRGQNWSKFIIEQAKIKATEVGLQQFVIPIRPTFKNQYPEIAMQDYLTWKKEERIFDPWIRTHLDAGAKLIKVCEKAMTIKGSLQEWENWTGQKIATSGKHLIKGTLSPVQFNIEKDLGTYEEPNIWISYKL